MDTRKIVIGKKINEVEQLMWKMDTRKIVIGKKINIVDGTIIHQWTNTKLEQNYS